MMKQGIKIDDQSNVVEYIGGGGDYDWSIYLKHGWLMWAAWGIFGFL